MLEPKTMRILPEFRAGLGEIMREAGISQTALADAAKVTRHWLNQVVLGKRGARVSRDSLAQLQPALLRMSSGQEGSRELKDRVDSLFERQLGYQEKTAANWNQASAVQVAAELHAGLMDDGLSKQQMAEVSNFLQALVNATKEE